MVQWLVEGFLALLGLKVLSIRGKHIACQRAKTVAQFNDPTMDIDAAVASMQTSSLGVNFHAACHNVVFIEWAENASTLLLNFLMEYSIEPRGAVSDDKTCYSRLEINTSKVAIVSRTTVDVYLCLIL